MDATASIAIRLCAMTKPRILFLCTGNACRSQMAEGWLRHLASDSVEALSAGITPHGVNPLAVEVMAEVGVDLSPQRSEDVARYLDEPLDLVVAVCDSAAEACPTFPRPVPILRAPFPDPAAAEGSPEEVRRVFREVRDAIGRRIETWIAADFSILKRANSDGAISNEDQSRH